MEEAILSNSMPEAQRPRGRVNVVRAATLGLIIIAAGGHHDGDYYTGPGVELRTAAADYAEPPEIVEPFNLTDTRTTTTERSSTTLKTTTTEAPPVTERKQRTGAKKSLLGSKELAEARPEILRPPVGNYEFLGAMEIHRHTNATPGADDKIVHRLNTGGWKPVANGEKYVVDVDPMLDYGFVLDQSSGQPPSLNIDQLQRPIDLYLGRPGKTTVIASHNVTTLQPADAAVSVGDGSEYVHPRAMLSAYNEQQRATGQGDYRPNVSPNDQFVIRLNNPDNTQTVLTYRVQTILEAVIPDSPEFNAWYEPPADPQESRLVVYYCWPPGSLNSRAAALSTLESSTVVPGQVTYAGDQIPKWATANR